MTYNPLPIEGKQHQIREMMYNRIVSAFPNKANSPDLLYGDIEALYYEYLNAGLLPVDSATKAELDKTYARIGATGLYVDPKMSTTASATENTTAINTAMATASSVGATVFIPAGTYNLNDFTVTAPLKGAAKYATILNAGRATIGANNIELSNFKLISSDPYAIIASQKKDISLRKLEVSHSGTLELALLSDRVNRLNISRCKFNVGGVELITTNDFVIESNYWDAQYLNINEPLHVTQQSSGIVSKNTIKNTLTDAIDLYSSGEYCVISDNRFYGIKGNSGIEAKVTMSDVAGNSSGPGNVIDGVIIANNVLKDFSRNTAAGGLAGIYAEFVDSRATPTYSVAESNRAFIITNNVLEDFNVDNPGFAAHYSGIIFTGHNGIISDNVIRNIPQWNSSIGVGINLAWSVNTQKCVGVQVSNNNIAGIQEGYGIQTGNMDRCQITNNSIRQDDVSGRNTKHGINIIAGVTLNHCNISNNTFECNTATSFGIRSTSATSTFNRCVVSENIFKDCGVSLAVAQFCSFIGNTMDNATNSQSFSVGVTGTSCRGNIYNNNQITMSADYALSLVDHDGFTILGNSFNNTARAVLLNGVTKNGIVDNNISIIQTLGTEFPHYSGVSAGDQATISVGTNKVLT